MKTTKELEQLIKMLKKQGVYQFQQADLVVSISPTLQEVKSPRLKDVSEDDLYYSSGSMKTRIRK